VDLQYTSEREADQLWQVTPAEEPFVLHCEFQSTNDRQMLSRMLLYYGFLYYQKKLPLYQYVLYVGKDSLQMEATFASPQSVFLLPPTRSSWNPPTARKYYWPSWPILRESRRT
jgi:hypothetical protein